MTTLGELHGEIDKVMDALEKDTEEGVIDPDHVYDLIQMVKDYMARIQAGESE